MYDEGKYFGKLAGCGTAESKKKIPYFWIEFEVTHRDNAGEWAEVGIEKRTVFLYLSDQSMPYTMPKLEKLGFNGDFAKPELSPPSDWNGGIMVECKHETYEGKPREKWELAGAGGDGMQHQELSADQIRRLNALWKNGKKPGVPVAPATRTTPKKNSAPAPVAATADEVPF